MRPKFNRAVFLATALVGLSSVPALAEPLPLIVPETTFGTLARITGDTLNQRLMDLHSTIRVQLNDPAARLRPDTPLLVFRQGLRLSTPDGRVLGVLAVPVAKGQTLSEKAETNEITNPDKPGVAWMRLQSLQQEVMRGDSVMTRSDAQAYAPTVCEKTVTANAAATSQVLAIVSQADMISSAGDLLAVSGGCAAGLSRGSKVTLWRPAVNTYGRKLDQPVDDTRNDSSSVFDDNPAITRTQTPGHRVGTATVLATHPNTAIIRIQDITQAAQPGDLVRPSPAKTRP